MISKKLIDCSRLTAVVGLALALVLAVGATGWGQTPNCCQNSCQFPSAGQVRFPVMGHTEAMLGATPVQFDVLGPAMVMLAEPRPDPAGDIIETEMLALELTGISSMGQPVRMHLTQGTRSMGQTIGQAPPSPCDLPAVQSFFDVFVEIEIDVAPGQTEVLYTGMPGNQYVPVHVNNPNLQCIPPDPQTRWCTPAGTQVPLTSRSSNQQVGVLTFACGTALEPNHYKTWRITDFSTPQIRTVIAKDQFMTDNLVLDSAVYLSNPVQKTVFNPTRVFNIADTTDHFLWYNARGRDTLLDVEIVNQIQQATYRIDSVKYFLLPARKFPHNPPKLLDHYKAYRIRGGPHGGPFPMQLLDQFDLTPEVINGIIPRYFLTPAQKQIGPVPEPVYDTLTHFIAYEILPKRLSTINRDAEDQFGIHPIRIDSSYFLLVPTCKLRATPPPEEEACCYKDALGNQICSLVPVGECAALGGTVVPACLGDGNGNGIDDACEQPQEEACCFTGPGGSLMCALVPAGTCESAYGGTVVPACLGDGNGNGVDDACDGPPTTGPNHFKTWRVLEQNPTGSRTVIVTDQLMQDNLVLDSIQYLSNPTEKLLFIGTDSVIYPVLDTTDHLAWYGAIGRDTLLGIEFRNQFGHDTVNIDRVKYLLVPTQKFPHNPPNRLDHYKAYRIRSAKTLRRTVFLQDQFDLEFGQRERIDSLKERYFLTPAQKQIPGQQPDTLYDTVTHYVAYQIYPARKMPQTRDIKDQFGIHIIQVDSSEFLLVPTRKLKVIFPPPPEEACCYIDPTGVQVCDTVPAGTCQSVYGGTTVPACLGDGNGNGNDDACEPPPPDTGSNHYKTWRVFQQDPVQFHSVFVKDQFKKFVKDTTVRLDSILYLSNPTRKIVFDATGADTFNVVDTTDHLSWYRATAPSLLKGLYVIFRNQFHTDTNRVDRVRYFLLPTRKFPHQPPDQLDHYKAYRIKKPRTLRKPFELQDQFDLMIPANPIERIDSLVERYFLTPAQKQIPGQLPEPTYDTVTHYVAYQIYPPRRIPHIRDTEDQFGIHILQVDSSELLLVPTTKLFVARKLKGDLNGSLDLSAADAVLMLNCAYLGEGDCDQTFTDLNCDGALTASDVVLELNAVFLDEDFPC